MIDPSKVAFDIDGVIADTMTLFLDIARDIYNIDGIGYEDITCYTLSECLDVDPEILNDIGLRIVDGNYTAPLKIFAGAREVLNRIAACHGPLLFVTARPHPGPIEEWFYHMTELSPAQVDIVTTGSFEGKTDVLLERNITHFVEDRLETCFLLKEVGVTPVVFKQPWNRQPHEFLEVGSWNEIGAMIEWYQCP